MLTTLFFSLEVLLLKQKFVLKTKGTRGEFGEFFIYVLCSVVKHT